MDTSNFARFDINNRNLTSNFAREHLNYSH